MAKQLEWKTEKREISSLIEFDHNPRILTEDQESKLRESLEKFGLVEIPAVDVDGTILAGHQRLKVYKKINGNGVIDVRVPNRSLTDLEREEYLIRSNKNTGEWDLDMLGEEFDAGDLIDWGFESWELNFEDEGMIETEEVYTKKIQAPIYEPTGDNPELSELVDKTKTIELVDKINDSDIPDNIKDFLITSAQRHNVFNYRNIAEYYAHADKDLQELMEQSALVIIDFNKAIENGFVKMTESIANSYCSGTDAEDDADESEKELGNEE